MRRMILMAMIMAAAALTCTEAVAQKMSVSTDLLGYANLGTLNLDASYAVSRRWSITAGARYNPFTFHKGEKDIQFQSRQLSYAIGARVWPWHTWSGWWFAGKMRYQEYNQGGFENSRTEEGDRFGTGIYSGYTHMLSPHFNLEFGLGVWAGLSSYTLYSCPTCGITLEEGSKYFVLPDDIMISLVYVF